MDAPPPGNICDSRQGYYRLLPETAYFSLPVCYANEGMARMLGYDAVEELIEAIDGKVINTIHPDDREQVIKDIGDEYYEGLTYETTYRMPRKDGSWFWTVDKGKVIQTEDGKLAIISACYDMTSFVERHKNQEPSFRGIRYVVS